MSPEETPTAAWYLAEGIRQIESIPVVLRDVMGEDADDTDSRCRDLDRRIRIMDTKFNEVLGLMHELGDRVVKATEALTAYAEASRSTKD